MAYGTLFLTIVAFMCMPLLVMAGAKFDEYLLKKFDERKARKTR
jgi:hypothetical protein